MADVLSHRKELKDRVEAKKRQLQSRLSELKADSRSGARDEEKRLRERLENLEDTLEKGWDNLTEAVAGKLNAWLKKDS